ncbi:MAG: Arc family DNA-binding protein [Mesorhizobium sp.]|nr:MAG: Arc family DNA-binding protein [Mesorhizobium sp.]
MNGMRNIAPTGVRIPDELKIKLQARARRNGRSMNSEIVKILQAAVDGETDPGNIEELAQVEADKFKKALLETLQGLYGKK